MRKLLLLSLLFIGCGDPPKIEPGDKVVKCVIDSMSMKERASVMDIEPTFYYYTKCGERIITHRYDVYHIGDTITYVYKKIK